MEVASEASGASILERIRRRPYPLLLVAPAFLVLFLLTIYPFLYMVWISLHKWPILPTLPRIFVGADTYAYIFRDGEFWNSVGVTSSYMAVSVGLQLALGLFLAMLLDPRYRAFQWFRLPFMIPVFVSPVVVGLIWKFMLGYDLGIVNHLLRSIGFEGVNWLGDQTNALLSLVLVDVWQWTPFTFLILHAGLMSLPREPYEAAVIDEIPREIDESAMLDGCGNLAVIRRMIPAPRQAGADRNRRLLLHPGLERIPARQHLHPPGRGDPPRRDLQVHHREADPVGVHHRRRYPRHAAPRCSAMALSTQPAARPHVRGGTLMTMARPLSNAAPSSLPVQYAGDDWPVAHGRIGAAPRFAAGGARPSGSFMATRSQGARNAASQGRRRGK